MKDRRRLLCLVLFALHLWSCHRRGAVLLFNGTGTSPNDVAAIDSPGEERDLLLDCELGAAGRDERGPAA